MWGMATGALPEPVGASLEVDRLPDPVDPIEVVWMEEADVGSAASRGARRPHRHDYHELIWMREGEALHLLDGQPISIEPGTISLIARGQVHVFERARAFTGVIVRFGEELLYDGPMARTHPVSLLAARGQRTVAVPESEVDRLEPLLDMLSAEIARRPDARSIDLQRHLLSTLLLWIERWHEAAHAGTQGADASAQLHRRFAQLLEHDFAGHRDTGHYADALGVPQAALSRALSEVTGRTTKELIIDRVMLEAARLLRFTDRSVNEVAYAVGFDDQLYFSRAFKRQRGEAPTAYRERLRSA
ncbi:MAG: AraC family transcriptional regulator, transcriptional activator of pobA [Thermoleophilaceae bacterium]|jgi:AraC family transcriptional activator of pobA|nr:AraC family transcriptional regulator, transcriptional activator of pobA [Thermoleophilaceae bacterium]